MALIDYTNKVIYWDEVNWQWVSFIRFRGGKYAYLVKDGKSFPVKSSKDVVKVLESLGFRFYSLHNLGIVEVSFGCFLYKGTLYNIGSKKPSIIKFIETVTGRSKVWMIKQLDGEIIFSKNIIDSLVESSSKVTYNGKSYKNYVQLFRELDINPEYAYTRLTRGDSLENLIEEYKPKSDFVKDHLGNQFDSLKSMLSHWGILPSTYHARTRKGWSLEEALTGKRKKKNKSSN